VQLSHWPSAVAEPNVRYSPGEHDVTVHGLGGDDPPSQKWPSRHVLQTPSDVAVHSALRYSPTEHVVVHGVDAPPSHQLSMCKHTPPQSKKSVTHSQLSPSA
jgi:hypothetical protein